MTFFKSIGFSLLLCLVFFGVTQMLPQVEGEAPVDMKVDLGALTMDSFIALGEEIFSGKGTCTLCHKPPPLGRAPDIQGTNMEAITAERLADERYQGSATDSETYLRESMKEPGQYVVAGWGKKGTNDSESPMPAIHKAPIELSDIEIDAVIAYLQSKDGNEVTVELPTEAPAVVAAPAAGSAPAPAATAEEAIKKYSCQACHVIGEVGGPVGPSLVGVGSRLTADQIRENITNPNAAIAEGFAPGIMPGDFATRMTVSELEMIVKLLGGQK